LADGLEQVLAPFGKDFGIRFRAVCTEPPRRLAGRNPELPGNTADEFHRAQGWNRLSSQWNMMVVNDKCCKIMTKHADDIPFTETPVRRKGIGQNRRFGI